jgi:Cd2+/Zn2+-exporting ATPase
LAFVPPLLFGVALREAAYRAITVMVVASPCALVISTPAAILSAIANGARRGILFKGGAHLEEAAHLEIVAFDKTGTLTIGKPTVTDVTIVPLTAAGQTTVLRCDQENILLALAAAVESKSEHPLARAIVETARHRGLAIPAATHFASVTGQGVQAYVAFMGGMDIAVGSLRYCDGVRLHGLERAMCEMERLQYEGKTAVLVARMRMDALPHQGIVLGVIAIADVLRPSAPQVVEQLHRLGIRRVVMLTGDNERVARAVARQAGVDEFHADLLPQDKVALIKRLREAGGRPRHVAMVGDGVNDAPALASASLGIAMGAAGTDVALETADVVLMSDDLRQIAYAIALSRQARQVIINLIFAIAVIAILVGAALSFQLPLPLGVVGHEGSTVIVVLNGLRLLFFNARA